MQTKTPEADVMAKYLLGELSDAEQETVEEKLFLDDDWFDRLRVAEMELIDRYVQGGMSQKERSQFERGFLTTPDKIEKVTNAKTFMRHVEQLEPARAIEPETSRPFWRSLASYFSFQSPAMQYAMAAAVLLLAVGGAWLVYDRMRLRREVYEARNQQTKQARESDQRMQQQRAELQQALDQKEKELQQQLARSQGKDQEIDKLKSEIAGLRRQQETLPLRQPGEAITTVLSAGPRSRGARGSPEPVSIYLKPQTKKLSLRVQLKPPIALRYNVSLSQEGGRPVKEWPGVRPRRTRSGQYLGVTMAASLLSEGDYVLRAHEAGRGGKAVSEYRIKVFRK